MNRNDMKEEAKQESGDLNKLKQAEDLLIGIKAL
jgi:hypothetical protein